MFATNVKLVPFLTNMYYCINLYLFISDFVKSSFLIFIYLYI